MRCLRRLLRELTAPSLPQAQLFDEEYPRCRPYYTPTILLLYFEALLFDEEYESHSYYQYRKARRWLGDAKAIVFVGTSFAVGVTLGLGLANPNPNLTLTLTLTLARWV